VLSTVSFPKQLNANEENVKVFLEMFLLGASTKQMQDFLKFCTGAINLPKFGLGKICVNFSNTDSIFSSTCLLTLNIPYSFKNYDTFSSSLRVEPTNLLIIGINIHQASDLIGYSTSGPISDRGNTLFYQKLKFFIFFIL